MNGEPGDRQDDLDRIRTQLHRLREGGAFLAFLDKFGPSDPLCDQLRDEAAAELERICQVIDALTPEERACPLEVAQQRLDAVAEATGISRDRIEPLIQKFLLLAGLIRDKVLEDDPPAPSAQILDGQLQPSALIRRIDLFTLLNPVQRAELWYRWTLMARVGRGPEYDRPFFAAWNRNLRLFDVVSDPRPAPARPGPGGGSE